MELFKYLKDKRETLKELWATGGLTEPTFEATAVQNASAQGYLNMIQELLSLEAKDLNEVD